MSEFLPSILQFVHNFYFMRLENLSLQYFLKYGDVTRVVLASVPLHSSLRSIAFVIINQETKGKKSSTNLRQNFTESHLRMAAAQISSSLYTSIRGKSSAPLSAPIFCLFFHDNSWNLMWIVVVFNMDVILVSTDVCVSNPVRISSAARLPQKGFGSIGTTFATGSPLCKLSTLHFLSLFFFALLVERWWISFCRGLIQSFMLLNNSWRLVCTLWSYI